MSAWYRWGLAGAAKCIGVSNKTPVNIGPERFAAHLSCGKPLDFGAVFSGHSAAVLLPLAHGAFGHSKVIRQYLHRAELRNGSFKCFIGGHKFGSRSLISVSIVFLYIDCQELLSLLCLAFLYAYNMDLKTMIASWIKQARKEAGLSGADLGAKLALELRVERGITRANVSHWETQKHSPSLPQLLAIAKITGKSLPDSIIAAMRTGIDAPPVSVVQQEESTLERLSADERALIQNYRNSTAAGREFMRKAGGAAEKDQTSGLLGSRSNQRQ